MWPLRGNLSNERIYFLWIAHFWHPTLWDSVAIKFLRLKAWHQIDYAPSGLCFLFITNRKAIPYAIDFRLSALIIDSYLTIGRCPMLLITRLSAFATSVVSRMKQWNHPSFCHPERSRRIWDSSIPRSLPWAQSNGLHSEWQTTIHPWHDTSIMLAPHNNISPVGR